MKDYVKNTNLVDFERKELGLQKSKVSILVVLNLGAFGYCAIYDTFCYLLVLSTLSPLWSCIESGESDSVWVDPA